jgi:hypothetical protein
MHGSYTNGIGIVVKSAALKPRAKPMCRSRICAGSKKVGLKRISRLPVAAAAYPVSFGYERLVVTVTAVSAEPATTEAAVTPSAAAIVAMAPAAAPIAAITPVSRVAAVIRVGIARRVPWAIVAWAVVAWSRNADADADMDACFGRRRGRHGDAGGHQSAYRKFRHRSHDLVSFLFLVHPLDFSNAICLVLNMGGLPEPPLQ